MLAQSTQTLATTLAPTLTLTPIVRELPTDLETPVSVYLKLCDPIGNSPSFLLESVEGGERLARYSFIGVDPAAVLIFRGGEFARISEGETVTLPLPPEADPLDVLRAELGRFSVETIEGLPRFVGGLVGYIGYDTVRFFEPKLEASLQHLPPADLPDAIFLLADTLVAFDHVRGRTLLIVHAHDGDEAAARRKLDDLEARLRQPLNDAHKPIARAPAPFESNFTPSAYEEIVRQAKEHIAAGDIFQVVPSQRLTRRTSARPFDIYRALRRLNPSPYMFYFDFGDVAGEPVQLVGASPEMHARLEGGRATIHPIAGTRPRGATPAEDAALEVELLADPKERAEHVMLVDLARNDLGRVCEYGSISVPHFFTVEKYSHVMHLVSEVQGRLRPEVDAFDLIRATFPAGTLTGAPKVRAMEIIYAIEPSRRGPYGGCVGFFSFDGAMDTCITIRTLTVRGDVVQVQAGGGVVADSDPEREYEESMNKAKALLKAVELAERRFP
ncbi:MAG TPA: anthranilate synthase component I [Anaerolineae bacterium]